MSENFENLEARLKNADPAKTAPQISESVVAQAALGGGRNKSFISFSRVRQAFLATALTATASVAAIAIAVSVQPQPLITLAGGSSANSAAQSEASLSSPMTPGMDALDGKMAFWAPMIYEYVDGGLSTETGNGDVFQLVLDGDPVQRLQAIAKLFGITGKVVKDEWATAEYPSYSIQGDNHWLSIYWSGTGSWSFSQWSNQAWGCEPIAMPAESTEASAGSAPDASATEPALQPTEDSGDGTVDGSVDGAVEEEAGSEKSEEVVEECLQPEPTPGLIPSESEVRAQAQELFEATGLSVSASEITVYRDGYGANATAAMRVNGQAVGIEWYAGWGQDGKLSYASGHNVKAISKGQFKTISAAKSLARVSDGRWFGSLASEYYSRLYAMSPSVGVTRDAAVSFPANKGEPGDLDSSEPMLVVITVTKSEAAMLVIYDSAGGVWLVPGHLLQDDSGWFNAVIALEDGVIELPPPFDYEVDIMPVPAG